MMNNPTHKIVLNIGDWSGDGHNMYDRCIISTNYSVKAIATAYEEACEKTGQRFENVASLYEDPFLPEEMENILKEHGWERGDDVEEWNGELTIAGSEGYISLLMTFIKIALPDLEWKSEKEDGLPILVGGYGSAIRDRNRSNVSMGYGLFSD